MARIDNLENFLTDVADAIKIKKEYSEETKILASNFDTEILTIEGGGFSDATAEAIDLLYPKTAYTNGGKITGAMIPTYGTTNNITITQLNSHNVILHSIDINCSVGITNNNSSIDIYMIKNKNLILDSKVTYTISQLGLPSNIESLALAYLYTDATHVMIGMLCSNNKMCSVLLDVELLECSNTVISTNAFSGGGFKAYIRAIPNTTNQFVTAGPTWAGSGYQNTMEVGICIFGLTATIQNLSYGQSSQRPIDNSSAYIHGLTNDGLHFTMSFYVPGSSTQIMYTFSRATTNDNFTRTATWGWGSTTYGRIYVSNDYYLYNGKVYDSESTEVGTFTSLNANFCILYNIPDTSFFVIQNGTTIHTYKVNQDGTIVEFPSTITSSVARRWGEPLISEQHTFFLTNNEYESPHPDQTNIISITRGNITYTALIDANAESHDVLTGKKYYKNSGLHVGTMPNNGQINITPTTSNQSIPAGYTSGGTVSGVTAAIDNNITGDNIKQGVEILGVTGTYAPTGGDATSDANIQAKYLLTGYSVVSDGEWVQGTMANYGTQTIQRTSETQTIPTGYYDSLTIPVAQAQNLDGYEDCLDALEYVNDGSKHYIELNYIESTGSQFISIDYLPKTTHTKYELGFMRTGTSGMWNPIINSEEDVRFGIMCTTDGANQNNYGQFHIGPTGSGNFRSVQFPISSNVKYDIIADKTGISLNGTTYEITGTVNAATAQWSTCVNHRRQTASTFSEEYSIGRWYYLRIYEDDVLIRNIVPMLDNKNNRIGLYDKITHTFYPNIGTGTFISGGVKE